MVYSITHPIDICNHVFATVLLHSFQLSIKGTILNLFGGSSYTIVIVSIPMVIRISANESDTLMTATCEARVLPHHLKSLCFVSIS